MGGSITLLLPELPVRSSYCGYGGFSVFNPRLSEEVGFINDKHVSRPYLKLCKQHVEAEPHNFNKHHFSACWNLILKYIKDKREEIEDYC